MIRGMRKLMVIFLDILLRVSFIKPIFRLLKKHKALLIVFLTALVFCCHRVAEDFSGSGDF